MRKEYANWKEYEHKTKPMNNRDVTRKNRRSATTNIRGKNVKILDFVKTRAKDLPEMHDKSTGKRIDHVDNLRQIYMAKGIAGVNEYVKRVKAIIQRDVKGTSFITRVAGWLTIKYFKLKDKIYHD